LKDDPDDVLIASSPDDVISRFDSLLMTSSLLLERPCDVTESHVVDECDDNSAPIT